MKVGELKELLSLYPDDALVLIEGADLVTNISCVSDVKYKKDAKLDGFQTFDYEYDDWDTTEEFANEKNACLIESNEYYIRALNPFRKEV